VILTEWHDLQAGAQPCIHIWGVQLLGLGCYYFSTEKQLDRSTQFGAVGYIITLYSSKSYVKSWGVRPNFGVQTPDPPVVVPMFDRWLMQLTGNIDMIDRWCWWLTGDIDWVTWLTGDIDTVDRQHRYFSVNASYFCHCYCVVNWHYS